MGLLCVGRAKSALDVRPCLSAQTHTHTHEMINKEPLIWTGRRDE